MSDFFSGLNPGLIRKPDATFGPGPLPTPDIVANGPSGANGNPDGKYDDSGGLLSGITPYSGPKQGRMGADRNYQQIPHRMQHIVHMLYLPYADKTQRELVGVSHGVDQGDMAFIINTNRIQGLLYNEVLQRDATISQAQMPSRNAFANISTVNYLLAGLQRLEPGDDISLPWRSLALDLGFDVGTRDRLRAVLALVRQSFVPYGICAGSEHQGGKHETGLAPVQSAVNHVTTMTVDGQNRDLVNYWRRIDLSAGDQLIFRLELLETQGFTLNHYYKGTVHQSFPERRRVWQLVPDVFNMAYDKTRFEGLTRCSDPTNLAYDYRLHGYWRIGQLFQHRGKHDAEVQNYSNDLCFLRGQLLQITFAPVWCDFEALPSQAKRPAPAPPPPARKTARSEDSKRGPSRSLGVHGEGAKPRKKGGIRGSGRLGGLPGTSRLLGLSSNSLMGDTLQLPAAPAENVTSAPAAQAPSVVGFFSEIDTAVSVTAATAPESVELPTPQPASSSNTSTDAPSAGSGFAKVRVKKAKPVAIPE